MYFVLLSIIYLAFVSLGLPDSLLGSAWPVMHRDLGVAQAIAGLVTMIISAGTIASSLASDRLTHRFGAGRVTAFSVFMTAAALLGFSLSTNFALICLWAVPYGLGAGAIDAALNNFVALHYSSRHMSWLHCCWGIGASISPYIMSFALTRGLGWSGGYRIVSVIQAALTAAIFLSLPLWRKAVPRIPSEGTGGEESSPPIPLQRVLRIPGAAFVFMMFFAYSAMEQTCMLWTSSFMVSEKAVPTEDAARMAALFTLGIMAGRFASGFISGRLGDRNMIRLGATFVGLGILLVALPITWTGATIIGMAVIGCGCGPIYPSIIHSTPDNFGAENSQAVIGIQMASAYIGTTFMPPFFGVIAQLTGMGLFPFYLMVFLALMLTMSGFLNRAVDRAKA